MADPSQARPPEDLLGPDTYAAWRASSVGDITESIERRLILELAGDVTGRDVLDVGCGDGSLAADFREKGARFVGIDPSRAMIADACERVPGALFCAGTGEALPFASESFDLVTAVTVLCFAPDAAPIFDEMARVLRPDGRLVIGELGRWSSWAVGRRLRAWLGSPLWRHGRFRTAGDLRALAEDAGLAVERLRGAVYYPRWTFAARLMAPCDVRLGKRTTLGAAFIALAAVKPEKDRVDG